MIEERLRSMLAFQLVLQSSLCSFHAAFWYVGSPSCELAERTQELRGEVEEPQEMQLKGGVG